MTFLYLLPAIGWGFMPIIAKLTNAKPINQLLGTTTIALLMGMFFTIIVQPSYNWHGFAASFFFRLFLVVWTILAVPLFSIFASI